MTTKITEASQKLKKKMSLYDTKPTIEKKIESTQQSSNEELGSSAIRDKNQENSPNIESKAIKKGLSNVKQEEKKSKVTAYLDEATSKKLDELFVNGILSGKKKDRSQIVCQAINLFYDQNKSNS